MTNHKKPLNRSITIGCMGFIVTLCILLSYVNLTMYREYVYQDYRGYIADILNYTQSRIDGDDLRTCIKTRQESDKYRETLHFMDDLMDHFDDIHYFYAILPLNTEPTGNIMSVFSAERYYDRHVDTEGNLYLGWISEDEFDASTAALFFEIMKGDDIVYFEDRTEWGTDFTGAQPIRDSSGQCIAVLAVDIDISFIKGMIRRYAGTNILVISTVGALFIGLLLLWLRRNVTHPIRMLKDSAVGFADRSHGQRNVEELNFDPPEMKTDNEIKALSDAVVKMTEDMRDYVTDIISAEEKAANMQELANRDALTGIGNKTAYDRVVRQIEAGFREGNTEIGLAVVDLNFLKHINDTYGHEKGDIAIQNLARLVCNVFDHSEVFRIGGDELVVILRGEDCMRSAELEVRFNAELKALASDEQLPPWERVSAAIGIALYDASVDQGMHSLFMRADHMMYDRKKAMKAARVE